MTTIGLSYSLVKISTKCAPALTDNRVQEYGCVLGLAARVGAAAVIAATIIVTTAPASGQHDS